MNNILMYCHNGSGNHGCEAIIRSTVNILNRSGSWQYYQITRDMEEDRKYGINELVELLPEFSSVQHKGTAFWRAYLNQKLLKRSEPMDILSNLQSFKVPIGTTVSLSIGGDNYCYKGYKLYTRYHKISKEQGHKTVLWGCSVEPEFLEYEDLLNDLKTFDKIVVRESISYNAMYNKGLRNLVLYPDPAFTLKPRSNPTVLPPDNTVGINISPMVLEYGSENSDIIGNYKMLIRYILHETDMQVALIPHVVWSYNNDSMVLQELKKCFSDEPRVFLVDDMDCTCLKAYIAKLRFFVGARTHATIAAYSTGVPTLVIGYSVKSRGIARDIFGTEEHYVIPANHMTDSNEITEAFKWIMKHEAQIRKYLQKFMPEYIEKAYNSGKELLDLLPVDKCKFLKTGIMQDSCVGCGACTSICPNKCLQMVVNREGFWYPEVLKSSCINCKRCKTVCPVRQKQVIQAPQYCYAIKNKNDNIRMNSSSGGVFSALAESILGKEGTIYGAALDENCSVCHIEVTEKKELKNLRGAKYSQSELGTIYCQVKTNLNNGKYVLFSGTPCQVAGLRTYLQKDYEKLICVDIICHGIPSPLVWKKYLEQESFGKLPRCVNFRSKKSGWSYYQYSIQMEYEDGSSIIQKNGENSFLQGIIQNLYQRPSCSDCLFKGENHPGDITLGDFWGIWNLDKSFDDDKGVSAVIVNTEKGKSLLKSCMEQFEVKKVLIDDIKKENPSWAKSSYQHKNRDAFFEKFDEQKVSDLVKKLTVINVSKRCLVDYLSIVKHRILKR